MKELITADLNSDHKKYPNSKLFFFFDEVSALKKFGRGFFVHNQFFQQPETNSKIYKEAMELQNREKADSKLENATNLFYGRILKLQYLISLL